MRETGSILLLGRYSVDGNQLERSGLFEYKSRGNQLKSVKYPHLDITFIRLFYVAMTRTKTRVYFLAPERNPSEIEQAQAKINESYRFGLDNEQKIEKSAEMKGREFMNIQIFGSKKDFDTKKADRYFKERGIKAQLAGGDAGYGKRYH